MSEQNQEPKKGWLARLRAGLARSSSRISQSISALFTSRVLDDEALDELEEILITSDMGVSTSSKLIESLRTSRLGKDVTGEEIRTFLADEIAKILEPVAVPFALDPDKSPHVILVVGVNGAGKTTTIGKIAKQLKDQGHGVVLAAGDTFRAAAVEQLMVWGKQIDAPVMARQTGSDAAGVAFDALKLATARKDDVLLIDTAGRLHNRNELMQELEKISRVLKKQVPDAPHTTLLVLDSTTGQNAHKQVEIFGDMVNVNGLVMTKLDGTAKGGVVVSLAEKHSIPVHYVGVGESAEDLKAFNATDFARGLMDLPAE